MITNDQRRKYFGWWRDACKAQGWTKENGWTAEMTEDKRHEIQAKAINAVKSSSQLTDEEFDWVKAAFRALADNLKGVQETTDKEAGKARRWIWVIKHRLTPCLRLYVGNDEAYLAALLRDRFKVFAGLSHWTQLSPSPEVRLGPRGALVEGPGQLQQFLITVSARVHAHRKEAGDSVHEMNLKARVKCECAACASRRAVVLAANRQKSGRGAAA